MTIESIEEWLSKNPTKADEMMSHLKTSNKGALVYNLYTSGYSTPDEAYSAYTLIDLRHLVWSRSLDKKGSTFGSYLKSVSENKYYKLSVGGYTSGIYGHESVNECLVSDLLDALAIDHLHYYGSDAIIKLNGNDLKTFVCWSDSFTKQGDSTMSLEALYDLSHKDNEDVIHFVKRLGVWKQIEAMIIVDFLIINRDRHGANIEFIKRANGSLDLAPLFDNGFSLVAPLQNNEDGIEVFDAMLDRTVNNFIGSKSLLENLNYVSAPIRVKKLTFSDINSIVYKYSAQLSQTHLHKISEILCKRYNFLEEGCYICH